MYGDKSHVYLQILYEKFVYMLTYVEVFSGKFNLVGNCEQVGTVDKVD